MKNSLLNYSGIPELSKVTPVDFEQACSVRFENITKIYKELIGSTKPANFANTIVPLDEMFLEFSNLGYLLAFFNSHNRTDDFGAIISKVNSEGTAFVKNIFHDQELSQRVLKVFEESHNDELDKEDVTFLKFQYQLFEDNGAFVSKESKIRLKEIDEALNVQCDMFNQQLKQSRVQHSVKVEDKSELKGIPSAIVEELARQASLHDIVGWLVIPERKHVELLLQHAHSRVLRKNIFESLNSLGNEAPCDNTDVIKKIHQLRYERATLINSKWKSFAHYRVANSMAVTIDNVFDVLGDYSKKATKEFDEEVSVLQKWVNENEGVELEPWDIAYYIEKYKNEKLEFDTRLFSEHLELENVIQGWLSHMEKQMNLEFRRYKDESIQAWQPEVIVYEVVDLDSQIKSTLFVDLFKKENKRGYGIWSSALQISNHDNGNMDIMTIGMNIDKAKEYGETLLTPDQVKSLYHEGGHVLFKIKSASARYRSMAPYYSVPEFEEIHSQLQENYPFHPDVLKSYAVHYKTNEKIPSALALKQQENDGFLSSLRSLMILQSSLYDLVFHKASPNELGDFEAIYDATKIQSKYSHLINPINLTRFHFIFSTSVSRYGGKFWSYIWSDACQEKLFEETLEQDLYDERGLIRLRQFYISGVRFNPSDAYTSCFENTLV